MEQPPLNWCPDCKALVIVSEHLDGSTNFIHPVYACPKELFRQWEEADREATLMNKLATRLVEALTRIKNRTDSDDGVFGLVDLNHKDAADAIEVYWSFKGAPR